MDQPGSKNPFNDRATMRRRFGYYFVGLAIGLVMLGLLEGAKRFARQQEQAQHGQGSPAAPQSTGSNSLPSSPAGAPARTEKAAPR